MRTAKKNNTGIAHDDVVWLQRNNSAWPCCLRCTGQWTAACSRRHNIATQPASYSVRA